MKLGILSFERQPLALDGKDCQNIGDYLQIYIIRQMLEELSLTDTIETVSKFELSDYDGDYTFLIMNCFDQITNQIHLSRSLYPISDKIIPYYISYSLASELSSDIASYLKQYEPIGCRDEYTMQNMRGNGIKAYLTGCITALMPRTALVPSLSEGGKIIFVDAPDSLEPFVPKEFQGHIERLSSLYYVERTTGEPYLQIDEYEKIYAYTIERMEHYRQHASLIVTARLHVASPCMAMGIPVIFATDNIDERFTWLDKFLPLYSRNHFDEIDWNPAPVEYEEDKKILKEMIKKRLRQEWDKAKDMYDISDFWENRKKIMPNETIQHYLLNVPIQHSKKIRYAIWGTVRKAEVIRRAIKQYFPHWTLTHAIDLNCEGMFEGVTIEKPEMVDSIDDVDIYIVVPPSAYKPVSKLLDDKNKKYILIDPTGCQWSDNINSGL